MSDESTAGWDAIEQACRAIYGDQEPLHFGTVLKYMLGGPDPIDGFSCYRCEDHWHIVTFGFTELYDKESPNRDYSGYGFELTMRIEATAEQPPNWAFHFLQNLARYVFATHNVFASGHHMFLNGPIALESDTRIDSVLFVEDGALGSIDTPNGRVDFVQVVGVTNDERQAAESWDTEGLAALMRERDPHLVTRLARASHLEDAAFADAVSAGRARDGSRTGTLFINQLAFDASEPRLVIGAIAVDALRTNIAGRLPFGNRLLLQSNDLPAVGLAPSEAFAAKGDPEIAELHLPAAAAAEIVEVLAPKRGDYRLQSCPLVIEVIPTEVRDNDNAVSHVIG